MKLLEQKINNKEFKWSEKHIKKHIQWNKNNKHSEKNRKINKRPPCLLGT